MKKAAIILSILVLNNACNEKSIVDEQTQALNSLKALCNMESNELIASYNTECLTINPFYMVGEKVDESLQEMEKLLRTDKIKNEDLSTVLIGLIQAKLPPELTKLSNEGYTETESEFFSIISGSILNDDINTLNFRISCVEDLIYETEFFNLEAQKRLLVYCTVVKGISNFMYQLSTDRKPETWDDCFRRKQQESLDAGFIAKMVCVINWPLCFGVMAADCALEQIT